MNVKMKLLSAFLLIALCFGAVAAFSGCSASLSYTLNEDEEGNKYYTVAGAGYVSNLSGTLEIAAYYGTEGTDNYAPVTEIAEQAFANSSVKKVIIPATVTKIGTAAFAYCTHLSEVEFAEGSALTEIAWGMFGCCTSLQTVNIPETVTVIAGRAFYECASLCSVSLPSGLQRIGILAFYGTGLTEIVIPRSVCDTETVADDGEGNEVTQVSYGLGQGAFFDCENLTLAVVNAQIGTLRSSVFGYCLRLTEVYLPATLKTVEGAYYIDGDFYLGHAFHNCPLLTDVYFAGSQEEWAEIEIDNEVYSVYDNSALLNAAKHYGSVYSGA